MRARPAAIVVGALDCVASAVIVLALLESGSDQATRGFDVAGVWVVLLLLLVTGIPALLLAWMKRAPRIALILALAFPVAFVLVSLATVIAFM